VLWNCREEIVTKVYIPQIETPDFGPVAAGCTESVRYFGGTHNRPYSESFLGQQPRPMLDLKNLEAIRDVVVIGSALAPLAKKAIQWLTASDRHAQSVPPVFAMERRKILGCLCNRKQPDPNAGRFRMTDGYRPFPLAA
jgi:hypothetical protein